MPFLPPWSRPLVVVVLLLVGAYVAFTLAARPRATPEVLAELGPRPLVIAHRGGRGLGPENTLTAFEAAWSLGADMLELDVHLAADGELVVIHDDTVDRTTDGSGAVAAFTAAQLAELDAGFHWSPPGETGTPWRGRGVGVPSLARVFAALPDAAYVIEIKPDAPEAAAALCEELRDHDMVARVLVASFHDRVLSAFRRRCPEVATSAGPAEVRRLYLLSLLRLASTYRPQAAALQVPERFGERELLTRRFVRAAQAKGVEVQVWTVNDTEAMRRLLDLEVDGLITDRPDLALQLLGRAATDPSP